MRLERQAQHTPRGFCEELLIPASALVKVRADRIKPLGVRGKNLPAL